MSERGALEPQEWRDLDLARLPDGRLAIISDRDGTLRLWLTDPSGKEAPSSLDAGAGPSQVAASRDGRFLAVTTEDGIRLVEVDGGATRMLTETAGDSDPSFSHDGRHVLFNRRVAGEHQIHRVTLDGHVNATGAKGLAPVSFDATDDFVFFAEGRGTRHPMLWSAARGTAAPLSPTLPAGRYGRLDLSPDGKQLAIPRNGTEVVIVDRASGKIARTLTMAGDELDRSIFAADGSLFALRVRWVGDIWVADLTD
ncbi:MAG: PD40 domain-containing protein [Myxococcales bacterium]|nr:PD40 domain-containing protein [Myxococcales bacterium]